MRYICQNALKCFVAVTMVAVCVYDSRGQDDPSRKIAALQKQLASKDSDKRAEAANGLAKIGRPAKDAIPDLVRVVLDPTEFDGDTFGPSVAAATKALIEVAPPSFILECIPLLRRTGRDLPGRGSMVHVMVSIYQPGHAEIDQAILDILKTPKDPLRHDIAHDFIRNFPLKSAIPHLIEMLKENDVEARNSAVVALRRYGPEASAAIPFLKNAGEGFGEEQRWMGLEALAPIGRENKEVAEHFRRVLRDPKVPFGPRCAALLGLRESKFASSAMEDLLEIAEKLEPGPDGHTDLAGAALWSISDLNPGKREAQRIRRVFQKLDRTNDTMAICGAKALARCGNHATESVPDLIQAATDPTLAERSGVLENYAEALGKIMGREAAASRLMKHLKSLDHPDARVVESLEEMIAFLKGKSDR